MRTRLNGFDMFYSVTGEGPAVLLLHGFPLDHTIWEPQAEHFSRKYTVVTPDLRGHGQSEATAGPYTMRLLAEDAKALVDHLQLGPVVLGGLSMGGYVALEFMRLFPERVKGLLLLDTKAEADTPEAASRREQQAQSALKNGPGELADQMITKMFTDRTRTENPRLVEKVRAVMRSTNAQGIAGALRGMAQRPDSTPLLHAIKVPTLIIVGSEDSLTTVEDARKMASGVGNSQLVIVPGAAHLTTLEKPAEVNQAIDRFLRRVFQ